MEQQLQFVLLSQGRLDCIGVRLDQLLLDESMDSGLGDLQCSGQCADVGPFERGMSLMRSRSKSFFLGPTRPTLRADTLAAVAPSRIDCCPRCHTLLMLFVEQPNLIAAAEIDPHCSLPMLLVSSRHW